MEIITGSVTTGDNFFAARNKYVEELSRKVAHGDVLISGPRRTGKTSLIKQYLLSKETTDKQQFLFLNLEDTKNLYHFYFRLIRELLYLTNRAGFWAGETSQVVTGFCNKLSEIVGGKIRLSPDLLSTEVEASIDIKIPTFDPKTVHDLQNHLSEVLGKIPSKLVIVLDEFPEIIFKFSEEPQQRVEHTKLLLSGLRAVRQKLRFDEKKNHRVIIAGSVNLRSTLNGMQLAETINDLEELKLQNLTPNECFTLLKELSVSNELMHDSWEQLEVFIQNQFGYSTPYYIQLFADYIRNDKIQKGTPLFTLPKWQAFYKQLIVGDRGPSYFLKRLQNRQYYSDAEAGEARKVLAFIAGNQRRSPMVDSTDENLKAVVTDNYERTKLIQKMVCDDFLQISDGGNYEFESQLICNFWHHNLNGGSFLK